MLLRLFVVVDAHEEDVAGVVGYLRWIFLALDLVDDSVGGIIVFLSLCFGYLLSKQYFCSYKI